MHFLRSFLVLYFAMGLSNCCQELEDSSSCQKEISLETTCLESSNQCESRGPPKVDKFLENHVNKIFQDGELNLFNLQRVMSDIMNDPNFRVLLEGIAAQGIDDTNELGNDKIIGMDENDVGGTCNGFN